MACPRILLQSVHLCSRICQTSSLTVRLNLLSLSTKTRNTNILPNLRLRVREFSCTTTALIKEGRLFSKEHEWILPKSDASSGTVGISEYAQEKLGDIVYIELPDVGTQVSQGDTYGVVESVKAASDLCAMIDGEILEINEELETSPERVNNDSLNQGWMLKMTIANPQQLDTLMSENEYQEFVNQESDEK